MTHHNHVHNYILASVLHKWQSHQTDQLEELKQRETVSLAGDMRADNTLCKVWLIFLDGSQNKESC